MAQNPVAIVNSVEDVVVMPELGHNDRRGVIGLTVKFGRGGHLSLALDDAMANSLFEMLGVLTGRVTPKAEKSSN